MKNEEYIHKMKERKKDSDIVDKMIKDVNIVEILKGISENK